MSLIAQNSNGHSCSKSGHTFSSNGQWFCKVATVEVNLATVPAQMATPAQILVAILIKAVIKCIERDGNNESFYIRDEKWIEIAWIGYKNRQFLSKTCDVWERWEYYANGVTKLLRLMLVASGLAPSTFLDFVVFPLSPYIPSSLGQHDVGHKGVATGRRAFSLCSLLNRRFRFSLSSSRR